MSWEKIQVGDLCEIKHGYAFKGKYFTNEGDYILLTPGNFKEHGGLKLKGKKEKFYVGEIPPDYILEQDDLLVVLTDLIQAAPILGGAAFIPNSNKFLHNQRLGKVVNLNEDRVDAKFFYYSLNEEFYRGQIRGSASGATVRHTAPERIYQAQINVPTSLKTQKKIASILSAYDDLIENNLKRIKLLEEAAQRIYKEWFVDFKFPNHENTPVNKETGLPEGWEMKMLKEVCFLTMGQSPKSEYYNTKNDGLPFHQGVTGYGNRFVEHSTYCTRETRIAEENDILCSVRAPVGRLNIAPCKLIIGRGLSAIRNRKGFQSFQYYQLKSHFYQEDMIGGGAIFNSVTKKVLEEQNLVTPIDKIISDYEKIVKPMDEQIVNLDVQNQNLKEARDLLLPRLMNRTIEV